MPAAGGHADGLALIALGGGVALIALISRPRPGTVTPPPNNGPPPSSCVIPPLCRRRYTFGGFSCVCQLVDSWILRLIADDKITVDEARALVCPPLSGDISAWLRTLQHPLGALDLQSLAFRCGTR